VGTLKAAYINELYKLSKKKKITVAMTLSIVSVIIAAIVVYSIKNFAGIRVTGSSEFSLLVLSVLSYTLIPLFVTFVCIDMFSGEFVDQTIKMTLTGPASRAKVFLAKVFAVASFIMANLLFVMMLSVIASAFISNTPISILKVLLSYIATFLPIFVYALAVIVISNMSKGVTSAFTISVLVFLLSNGLEIAFPHFQSLLFTSAFDFYRLLLGSYINFSKIIRILLILSGYGMMLFGLGYFIFEKKDF